MAGKTKEQEMDYLVALGWAFMSWLAYGIARLGLTFLEPLGLPQVDMVALSFLAGIAMFVAKERLVS